jgi:hypothetical protein
VTTDLSGFDKHTDVGSPVQKCPLVWIEIELVDEEDQPVPGKKYRITLPNGRTVAGNLDGNGFTRHDGIPAGDCKITFPEMDSGSWDKV